MAGQYYTFGPYMGEDPNTRPPYYDSNQLINDSRVLGPQGYADAVAFWYRPDPSLSMFERQHGAQNRPGGAVATEHVKHRRTRSGCYTCRSRRVKCDEKRPVCARCKKGNRDCVYPDPSNISKGGSRSKAKGDRTARQNSQSSDEAIEDRRTLETIRDEVEEDLESEQSPQAPSRKDSSQSLQRWRETRHPSESSSAREMTSPSTEASTSFSGSQTPASSIRTMRSNSTIRSGQFLSAKWSHLKPEIQTYLEYHQDNISFYYYFLKMDASDFIHTEMIDLAISYEPLLYAIVGFSAYHHTVKQPNGKLSTFLKYYSQSLSLLRKTLESGRKPTEATILTILTLGTFEEYLGDWVNLRGHHNAALQLIKQMFTPETIMNTEASRQVFLWCARFDVIVGLLGGNSASFEREWYIACDDWYAQLEEKEPLNIYAPLGSVTASIRLIGFDMAGLLASLQGTMAIEEFMAEYNTIGERIDDVRLRIQALNDGQHAVTEFPHKHSPGPYDIVDPYIPGGLFAGPLFLLNLTWIDWYAIKLMYRYQLSKILGQMPPPDLGQLAYEQCRIFEAIDRWPDSPPGATLGAHASLGIASVFLPKEERPIMWCRLKLAHLEQEGYIYPMTFRLKMAEMWQIPDLTQWWLPNNEGFHPVLQSIRAFSEERASNPSDDQGEDIRDMKMIFSKLALDESSPSDSSRSPSTRGSATGIGQHAESASGRFGTPSGSSSSGTPAGNQTSEGQSPHSYTSGLHRG